MSSYHEDVSLFLLFRGAPGAICKRPPHGSSLPCGSSRHLFVQRTPTARQSMETGNTGCLPQSQYRVSKSTRPEISNFQSSHSLSASSPSSCTMQQQKMKKMWQSEDIINNFLLPHSFGYFALLGYKQHVSLLTPHPTVVFQHRPLQNPLGWKGDRKQEAPKPGLFSAFLSLSLLTHEHSYERRLVCFQMVQKKNSTLANLFQCLIRAQEGSDFLSVTQI